MNWTPDQTNKKNTSQKAAGGELSHAHIFVVVFFSDIITCVIFFFVYFYGVFVYIWGCFCLFFGFFCLHFSVFCLHLFFLVFLFCFVWFCVVFIFKERLLGGFILVLGLLLLLFFYLKIIYIILVFNCRQVCKHIYSCEGMIGVYVYVCYIGVYSGKVVYTF